MRSLYGRADVTHTDLINALGMTKGTASKVITKLETKGLAKRHHSTDDLREQALALTAQGNKLVPKLAAIADDNDAHFFGHLPDLQRKNLIALMKDLVNHHELKQIPTR